MKKLLIFIFLFFQITAAHALATAKATVLVVDENGVPLEGVDAGIGFSTPKKSGWGSKSSGNRGLTDKEGKYTSSGATERILRYGARHPGYYTSRHEFTKFTGVSGILGFRKWQPWNPTLTVVLKKIKNPIAMYVYTTELSPITIPDTKGTVIGYDLVKHDWVSPYGKGITADFLFRLEDIFVDKDNYKTTLTVGFSNSDDGLQKFIIKDEGSSFLSKYHAPLGGYQKELVQVKSKAGSARRVTSYKTGDDTNYYFRVRCKEGELESCLYGKIYGNIEFSATTVGFKYFLNPTPGDTNIEFDPKRNLFKNLEYKISTP